jgi:phosphate transport system ATP-binding protein
MLRLAPDSHLQFSTWPSHVLGQRPKITVDDLSFWYGPRQALKHVSLDIYPKEVTAFLGPSGCGKTTLLRCFNRMNEIIEGVRMEGHILVDGEDIYSTDLDPPLVRSGFGWIAQRPNPFPWSIRSNVVYGPTIQGIVRGRKDGDELAERVLREVGLWDEVKDRLKDAGTDLSIGQQQRLCIARAIATDPEVLLMDEPCSALDPVATAMVEDLIERLRASYTIVIVTHNLQQAARIAQRVAFFHLGELLEVGDTKQIFLTPKAALCRDFVTGRYG